MRGLLVDGAGGPLSAGVAGANVHDTKLLALTLESLALTLESIVVDRPADAIENPGLDKGCGNPTGHQAVAGHGYRGHIRRMEEEKLDAQGVKRSRPTVGCGANFGMAVKVPCNPGALRQEGIQLHRPRPIGLRSALVPPPAPNQILRSFLSIPIPHTSRIHCIS